eukprot:COSAG04_NODE_14411_length_569_cov_0.968085_1_plen_91_part_10
MKDSPDEERRRVDRRGMGEMERRGDRCGLGDRRSSRSMLRSGLGRPSALEPRLNCALRPVQVWSRWPERCSPWRRSRSEAPDFRTEPPGLA